MKGRVSKRPTSVLSCALKGTYVHAVSGSSVWLFLIRTDSSRDPFKMKHWHACFTLDKHSSQCVVWGRSLSVFWVRLWAAWSNTHGQLCWTLSARLCQLSLNVPDSFLIPVQPLKRGKEKELGWESALEKLKDKRGDGQPARSQCPVIGQGKHWHDEVSSKEWRRGEGEEKEQVRPWERMKQTSRPRCSTNSTSPLRLSFQPRCRRQGLHCFCYCFIVCVPVKSSSPGRAEPFPWWEEPWRCCRARQSLKMSDSSIVWTCRRDRIQTSMRKVLGTLRLQFHVGEHVRLVACM